MISKFNWFSRPKLEGVRQILDFLVEGSYLVTIFLIPLWFSYWLPTYNIFELNKICVFQILLFLLLFFVALRLIYFPISLPIAVSNFFKKYWLIPTIFIVGLSLTLLSSSNAVLSFYGSTVRSLGLKSYLLFYLWFILLISAVVITSSSRVEKISSNIRRKIRRIVVTAVISGLLVSLYGILQILNIDFLTWPEEPYLTGRTFSSFGQPNFLASWLLFVVPLSFYLFCSTRHYWMKFFYFFTLIFQLICFFLTGSRGGLIALLLTIGVMFTWLFSWINWSKRQKILALIFFLILVIVSLGVLNFSSHGRVRDLTQFKMGSSGARMNLYSSAVDAISNRPFFGYGFANEREVFIRYYVSDWGIYGQVNQSADRAHNLLLDILLVSGIFGLILYVILYANFFKITQENIKNNHQRFLSLVVFFGLVAYLFSLFFSFTMVTGEMYVWLFFALLVLINFADWLEDNRIINILTPNVNLSLVKAKKFFVKITLTLVMIISAFFLIYQAIQTLIADYNFNKIYLYISISDHENVLNFYDKLEAQDMNSNYRAEYDSYLGDKLSNIYVDIDNYSTKTAFQKRFQKLVQRLPEQGYLNLYAKAKLYKILGEYSKAQECLTKIIELTPHWPSVYLEQANLSVLQGDTKGAIVAYNLALLNLPNSNDPRLNDDHLKDVLNYKYFVYKNMAEVFLKRRDYVLAEKYYQLAYKNKIADYTLLKKIADTYYLEGNLASAIKYNRHGFARNKQDYNWPLALAILYHESGDNRQALNYVQQALKLEPNNETLKKLSSEYEK